MFGLASLTMAAHTLFAARNPGAQSSEGQAIPTVRPHPGRILRKLQPRTRRDHRSHRRHRQDCMVLVIRTDLVQSPGKLVREAARIALRLCSQNWQRCVTFEKDEGMTVVKKVVSQESLVDIYQRAKLNGVSTIMVKEKNGVESSVGVGPTSASKLKSIVGHLESLQ